ncbi:MAG: porin [Thermodesulfobacteriota bacterium]|nr:porin [Thermodesulfobacteriota bacterium]
MTKWVGVFFLCMLFLLSVVVTSHAELSSDELLQILIEKGIVTEEDIDKAKASRKEGKEAQEKAEVVVKGARRPMSVNFKGRVQARYTSIENGDLNRVVAQKPFDQSEFDGFVIRRMRLRWFGNVTDEWKYHVQISADGDHNDDKVDPALPDYELRKTDVGVMLQDAFFTYDAHPFFNVTVGQFKSRFSPSYLVAGPVLPLCERPLVIDKLARRREVGMSIESAIDGQCDCRGMGAKVYNKPIFYAVGLYNGNGFNKMRNDNENLMVTGMLLWRPLPYINFGVSYAYDQVGYDYETTVLGNAEVSDTGDSFVFPVKEHKVAKNVHIWDFNTALDAGPVHLQVEYVQQDGNEVSRAYGYGIQGQYDLRDNFQLTARYDEFDPNVDVDNTFDSRWYTLGYNWFLHGQSIKWQLNYTFREEMHGEDVDNDALVTHFQVLF